MARPALGVWPRCALLFPGAMHYDARMNTIQRNGRTSSVLGLLATIKGLMEAGEPAKAEALCREGLSQNPGNPELKMYYGLCRQLQGDEETFRNIHDELAPRMAAGKGKPDTPAQSLWRKYHRLWRTLIIGALVLGAGAAGMAVCGDAIRDRFSMMINALYAGPPGYDTQTVNVPNNQVFDLYGGPAYFDRTIGNKENQK